MTGDVIFQAVQCFADRRDSRGGVGAIIVGGQDKGLSVSRVGVIESMLQLQYTKIKIHAHPHEIGIIGFLAVDKTNFPAAKQFCSLEWLIGHNVRENLPD